MTQKHSAGRAWTWFFWVAAIFNFAIGAAGMFAPAAVVDARIVGILVFGFGIVYAVVARDPEKYAQVLWAGVFGKVGVVAILASTQLSISGHRPMAIILVLDLLFAFGFLLFLLTRSDKVEEVSEVTDQGQLGEQ